MKNKSLHNRILSQLRTPSDPLYQYIGELGEIDVVKDFHWAVFDGSKEIPRNRVPSIRLTEYQPTGSQTIAGIEKLIENAIGSFRSVGESLDYYKSLYNAKPTGNTYILPYFTSSLRSKSNEWETNSIVKNKFSAAISQEKSAAEGSSTDNKKGLQNRLNQVATIAKGAAVAGSIFTGSELGVEFPKQWKGSQGVAEYNFSIILHNTMSLQSTQQNWALVTLLTYNNSYNRRNLILQDAPALYKVEIPGVRYSPASIMKNISVTMLGQMRKYSPQELLGSSGGEIIMPEAYQIEITMEDLFAESRQLLSWITEADKRVEVTSQSTREIVVNGVERSAETFAEANRGPAGAAGVRNPSSAINYGGF